MMPQLLYFDIFQKYLKNKEKQAFEMPKIVNIRNAFYKNNPISSKVIFIHKEIYRSIDGEFYFQKLRI